jgi:hypothetical protein
VAAQCGGGVTRRAQPAATCCERSRAVN